MLEVVIAVLIRAIIKKKKNLKTYLIKIKNE